MKRLKYFLLTTLLLTSTSWSYAKVNVITTTSDLAAIAKEVAGDNADVSSIAAVYQDPHFVDAKPSYLMKLKKADLFVQVGFELEVGWAPSLLTNARNPKILPGNSGFLDVSEGCDILEKNKGADRSQGDVHPLGNPHYWLDPENGRVIAKSIAARLSELDPTNAAKFKANLAAFETKLTTKGKEWSAMTAPMKGMKAVFYHNSWSNFEKRFGIEAVNFIEPRPGIPPSPSHIQSLTNQIKAEGVKVILIEPYFDSKLPEKIARDTGAKLIIFPPSVGSVNAIASYTDLFDYDLNALSAALAGGNK
jgi:ABC-type Zn uptake system ZnuABC Zn-binding protein ZnuA